MTIYTIFSLAVFSALAIKHAAWILQKGSIFDNQRAWIAGLTSKPGEGFLSKFRRFWAKKTMQMLQCEYCTSTQVALWCWFVANAVLYSVNPGIYTQAVGGAESGYLVDVVFATIAMAFTSSSVAVTIFALCRMLERKNSLLKQLRAESGALAELHEAQALEARANVKLAEAEKLEAENGAKLSVEKMSTQRKKRKLMGEKIHAMKNSAKKADELSALIASLVPMLLEKLSKNGNEAGLTGEVDDLLMHSRLTDLGSEFRRGNGGQREHSNGFGQEPGIFDIEPDEPAYSWEDETPSAETLRAYFNPGDFQSVIDAQSECSGIGCPFMRMECCTDNTRTWLATQWTGPSTMRDELADLLGVALQRYYSGVGSKSDERAWARQVFETKLSHQLEATTID